ncbi:MAG: hypothetical protein LIP77_00020, partial [Planctomycetes bacterium]|nr:hypothetical protein [Planctomycetota bacterium]
SPAAAGDARRFAEAMAQPDAAAATPPPAAVDAGSQAAVPPATTEAPAAALGDRILQGMNAASASVQAGRSEAVDLLGRENITQADLLRANFAMLESSNLVSAIAKTTEKITQSVKTLQQG